MTIPEINKLIEQHRYEEAFAGCEKLLLEAPEQNVEILRTRAYGYARSGDYPKAVRDYETIINSSNAEMRDYYLAAYHALHPQQFLKAEKWFLEVLRQGEEQRNDYFLTATLFYLSYIQMQKGEYDEAIRYLDEAALHETDVSMPLPEVLMCTSESLRSEIKRRAKL